MIELFIDIITTSCLHSLRFMMVVTAVSIGEYIVMFFPFWWLTFSTMLFRNRFNCGDAVHQMFLFVHIMLLAFMAVNAARCAQITTQPRSCSSIFADGNDDFVAFAAFTAVNHVWQALLYLKPLLNGIETAQAHNADAVSAFSSEESQIFLRAPEQATAYDSMVPRVPNALRWCRVRVIVLLGTGFLWMLAALASQKGSERVVLLSVAAIITLVAETAILFIEQWRLPSCTPAHLSYRMGKFTIMVMAQAVGAVIDPSLQYGRHGYAAAAGVLLVALLFKIVYFDIDCVNIYAMADRVTTKQNKARSQWRCAARLPLFGAALSEMLWIIVHIAIALAAVLLGAASKVLVWSALGDDGNGVANVVFDGYRTEATIQASRDTFAVCISICLLSSAILLFGVTQGGARRERRCSKPMRFAARFVLCCLTSTAGLLPRDSIGSVALVWVVASLLFLQVVVSVFGAMARTPVSSDGGICRNTLQTSLLDLPSTQSSTV
eukprot:g345.t1